MQLTSESYFSLRYNTMTGTFRYDPNEANIVGVTNNGEKAKLSKMLSSTTPTVSKRISTNHQLISDPTSFDVCKNLYTKIYWKSSEKYFYGLTLTVWPFSATNLTNIHFSKLLQTCDDFVRKPLLFHSAVWFGNLKIFNMLVKRGIDVDIHEEENKVTALHIAAYTGQIQILEKLICLNADVNVRDTYEMSPLYYAAYLGDVKPVELLLKHNADVDSFSSFIEETPLSIALDKGHVNVVELLLKHNAKVNNIGPHRWELTRFLCYQDPSFSNATWYISIVELLLKHGADVDGQDVGGRTPLICSSRNNLFQITKLLLNNKANPQVSAHDGRTPLFEASKYGYLGIVNLLLSVKGGSDIINKQVTITDETPLTAAILGYHIDVVSLLIKSGANTETRQYNGATPFLYAVSISGLIPRLSLQSQAMVKTLIEAKVNINSQWSKTGDTALHIATRKNDEKLVSTLLCYNTSLELLSDTPYPEGYYLDDDLDDYYHLVDDQDAILFPRSIRTFNMVTGKMVLYQPGEMKSNAIEERKDMADFELKKIGETALHVAVKQNQTKIVSLLLNSGANTEARTTTGKTALYFATSLKHHDILKLLLEAKSKPDTQWNKTGETSLHIAVRNCDATAVGYLIFYDANLELLDNEGNTPLVLASAMSTLEIVKLLVNHGAKLNTSLIDATMYGSYHSEKRLYLLDQYTVTPLPIFQIGIVSKYDIVCLNFDPRSQDNTVILLNRRRMEQYRYKLDTSSIETLKDYLVDNEMPFCLTVLVETYSSFTIIADFRAALLLKYAQNPANRTTEDCQDFVHYCLKVSDGLHHIIDAFKNIHYAAVAYTPVLESMFPESKIAQIIKSNHLLFSFWLPLLILAITVFFTMPLIILLSIIIDLRKSYRKDPQKPIIPGNQFELKDMEAFDDRIQDLSYENKKEILIRMKKEDYRKEILKTFHFGKAQIKSYQYQIMKLLQIFDYKQYRVALMSHL